MTLKKVCQVFKCLIIQKKVCNLEEQRMFHVIDETDATLLIGNNTCGSSGLNQGVLGILSRKQVNHIRNGKTANN